MTVPVTNVICVVNDQDGAPVAGAKIEATLTGIDVFEGYVLPHKTSGVTDSSGSVTLALWPNQLGSTESAYAFKIIAHGKTQRIGAVVPYPGTDVYLHDIAALPPFPGKLDGQAAVDAAQDAQAAAEAARDSAAAQASASASSATASAASATTAAGHVTSAATQATNAAASATAAAGSATAAAGSATAAAGSATAAAASAAAAAADAASIIPARMRRSTPSGALISSPQVPFLGIPDWATKVTVELLDLELPTSGALVLQVAQEDGIFSSPAYSGVMATTANGSTSTEHVTGSIKIAAALGTFNSNVTGRIELTKTTGTNRWIVNSQVAARHASGRNIYTASGSILVGAAYMAMVQLLLTGGGSLPGSGSANVAVSWE